jgi:hypothetical protein
MIAFEVHLNGARICTAGVENGVLTTILSWVDGRGRDGPAQNGTSGSELTLHVGGLQAEENQAGQNLRWRDDRLKPGDSVLIKVVEAAGVDQPVSREPQDLEIAEKQERMFYERLREKYGNNAS